MLLASLLLLPVCIELAGWLVDVTFVKGVLHEEQMWQEED
jgi:hypothetical protein